MIYKFYSLLLSLTFGCAYLSSQAQHVQADSSLVIRKTTDFDVDGEGTASNWSSARWVDLFLQNDTNQKQPGRRYVTRVKVLYSANGIYFLFDCEDKRLTSTIQEDFAALYKEDVVEVFLWPDISVPIYFEYEISPLNHELVLLVPNLKGGIQGWLPWNYKEDMRVIHATSATGPQKKSMAAVEGWKAEFFIPFTLLNPLIAESPVSGTKWRGNFYRIDYDQDPAYYSWRKTTGSFHEFRKFGTLVFE